MTEHELRLIDETINQLEYLADWDRSYLGMLCMNRPAEEWAVIIQMAAINMQSTRRAALRLYAQMLEENSKMEKH